MSVQLLLSVGSDVNVLEARNVVLLRAGYAVRDALTSADAMKVFEEGHVDVVIVCHSIPESQRLQLIAGIRAEDPSANIILIQRREALSAEIAHGTVGSLDAPETLLRAISDTLARSSETNLRRTFQGCPARLALQLDLADAIAERVAARDELNERLQQADQSITDLTGQVLHHSRDCRECAELRCTSTPQHFQCY